MGTIIDKAQSRVYKPRFPRYGSGKLQEIDLGPDLLSTDFLT